MLYKIQKNTNTNINISQKFNNIDLENQSYTVLNKLKALNPNKQPQSLGKLQSRRRTSKTRQ